MHVYDEMKRQLIVLTTTVVLSINSYAHAFSSPPSRRPPISSRLQYRDDCGADESSAENQNQQQQHQQQGPTAKRRFRSRRTQRQQRQRQPRRRRERYPVSSFSQRLFSHSQILPPLDVSELPPTQDTSSTRSTTLSTPASDTSRFT